MGEFVEQSLEDLLPVFEQIERCELFSGAETRVVVKRCRQHEYKLQKQVKRESDFVHYVDYLSKFHLLLYHRRTKCNYWFKKDEIEHVLVNKIESLYRRVCDRFPSQLSLWRDRIHFNKQQNRFGVVSRVYLKMLQVHGSRDASLWCEAADWEFTENGSAENARTLLQMALRQRPKAHALWTALFRLELEVVNRIRRRQLELGGEVMKKEMADGDCLVESPLDDTDHDVIDALLELKVAALVFSQALQANPTSPELIYELWKTACDYDFASKLRKELFNTLETSFADSEWVWVAKIDRASAGYEAEDVDGGIEIDTQGGTERERRERRTIELYRSAVLAIPNNKMWNRFLAYVQGIYEGTDDALSEPKTTRRELLKSIFKDMNKLNLLTVEQYRYWFSLLENDEEKWQKFRSVLKSNSSVGLWTEFIQSRIVSPDADTAQIQQLFNEALKAIPEVDTLPIWRLAIDWASVFLTMQEVRTIFERAVTFPTDVAKPIRQFYLQWAATNVKYSESDVRKLCWRLSKSGPNTTDFYLTFVRSEMSRLQPKLSAVRKAFDLGVMEHGTSDVPLWIEYIRFEVNHGSPTNVPGLYQRALTQLRGDRCDEFLKRWALMNQSE